MNAESGVVPTMKPARTIASGLAGIVLVIAAIRFSFLNWIVDGPGWLVSRFTSIDFHEGDGAFGFLLSIFLACLSMSTVTCFAIDGVKRIAQAARLANNFPIHAATFGCVEASGTYPCGTIVPCKSSAYG